MDLDLLFGLEAQRGDLGRNPAMRDAMRRAIG